MKALYRAVKDGDENVFKCGKLIGENNTPTGYKVTDVYFVDNSGFGTSGEMALTASEFLAKVKAGKYYAITGQGQFQVYVTEYEKIAGSRKALYKELGILKSKLVRNNTRLTEYVDGRRTLRLHATDVLTWKPDGVIVLNSGGYRTHTTKERLNAFLPDSIRVYQKNYSWYVRQDGKKDIDFVDGLQVQA
jgi:hypothetical protein